MYISTAIVFIATLSIVFSNYPYAARNSGTILAQLWRAITLRRLLCLRYAPNAPGNMQITDWPEQNLLGLLYLIVLLLCCFGSGPKWVWAPVEALSAISLVSQYLVGVKAIQGWLFPAGCYGPHPTPGCNAIWAGLFASNDDPSWWDDWRGPQFVSYAIGEAKADFVRAQAARSLRLIPFMALQVTGCHCH